MVSTERRYVTDNFPVFSNAVYRGEYLYQVRLYRERALFQSAQSGILRMRVLLGFLEARVTVIDAVIKADQNLQYLSVVCSSSAGPDAFSHIMKRTAPGAILEELTYDEAEEYIALRAVRGVNGDDIPFSHAILSVHESRNVLYALLLEYRALIAEYGSVMREFVPVRDSFPVTRDYLIPFLVFEQQGSICAIPEFQVEKISAGANGSSLVQITSLYGRRILVVDDLLCSKEIDIIRCRFTGKKAQGYYGVSTPVSGGSFDCTLVVPALL
jgi:hypothetical protein